ncbi:MAG: UDP-N-acetyl-alpha-D-glucosamine C6 dehydratase [Elusimicrobia bacterium ADurb.Bin231]|nr:MAG: UDP-N-acetyl-alpha-D-glucosamine C6 dehydratase [Elusimicrobia bacterium ADurb.Bin231]
MKLFERYKRWLVVLYDLFVIAFSFWFAFFVRFEGAIPPDEYVLCIKLLPIVMIVRIITFYYYDLYRGILRYASMPDLLNIFKAVIVSSVIITIIIVMRPQGLVGFPRSVFLIDPVFLVLLVGNARFLNRLYRERSSLLFSGGGVRLLIIGAGDAGHTVLKEINNNPKLKYNVVGFIDDNESKIGLLIQGIPVLSDMSGIKDIVKKKKVEEIIIAIPSATRQQMEKIVSSCEQTKIKIKTMPAIGDIIDGSVYISQIKDVQIEDLLGRDVVKIDFAAIKTYLTGKRILVTGSGGSIGGEICRQIVKFSPQSLILFGRGENSIYNVHKELKGNNVKLYQVMGDVINKKKLQGVFRKYKPQVVFHAAANKHIHLLEYNPDEGVLNNIIGTKNLFEVCEEYGVEKLVNISTDKAADPASMLGYTKRIAEIYLSTRKYNVTRAMSVRFGNVLGSRGSVIPLFREQIKNGGPVTVTHKDMTRYFMTIPEAAQLVLQACVLGDGGEIFLLDMGAPVKITDLARTMIKLSGFEPETEIPIVFTGPRPGEKLTETLVGKYESIVGTAHQKIFRIKQQNTLPEYIEKDFEDLKNLAVEMDIDNLLRKIRELLSLSLPN